MCMHPARAAQQLAQQLHVQRDGERGRRHEAVQVVNEQPRSDPRIVGVVQRREAEVPLMGLDLLTMVEPGVQIPREGLRVLLVAGQQVGAAQGRQADKRPDHLDVVGVAGGVVRPVNHAVGHRQGASGCLDLMASDAIGQGQHRRDKLRQLPPDEARPRVAREVERRRLPPAHVVGPRLGCGGQVVGRNGLLHTLQPGGSRSNAAKTSASLTRTSGGTPHRSRRQLQVPRVVRLPRALVARALPLHPVRAAALLRTVRLKANFGCFAGSRPSEAKGMRHSVIQRSGPSDLRLVLARPPRPSSPRGAGAPASSSLWKMPLG